MSLGGVSVQVGGQPAGLIFVSPSQINFWVPPGTALGQLGVSVNASDGTVVASGTMNVLQTAPALFSLDASGQGPGAVLNAVTYQGAPFFVVTSQNAGPDKRTRLSLFGTGLRLAGLQGTAPPEGNVAASVSATALEISPATQEEASLSLSVEYAGPAPGFFGLDQVNVVLPSGLDGAGNVNIVLSTGTRVSNSITVQIWSVSGPRITSLSPAALPPGAPLTIAGAAFAGAPPATRNQIIISAANGLSATVLPLPGGSPTSLTAFVPPLVKDSQSAWYQGPVTVCVQTDGQQTCAAQPLVIQAPATVQGQPGNLLVQFFQDTSQTVLTAVQASGSPLAVQAAAFQQASAQALSNLQQEIADALAGTPQVTTLTLSTGQTIAVAFDVATIGKLEALLAAGQPSFTSLMRAIQYEAAKLKAHGARRPGLEPRDDFAIEQQLMSSKQLVNQLNNLAIAITDSQLGWAAAAFGACLFIGPEACLPEVGILVAAEPFYDAATLLDLAGVMSVELGPNSLSTLSTNPANNVQVPLWADRPFAVEGHFVAEFDVSLGIGTIAGMILSDWITKAIPFGPTLMPVFEPILSPVIGSMASGMITLGLAGLVPVTGPASQDVSLSSNTVDSDCIDGSTPPPGAAFFLDPNYSYIAGFQGMAAPQECNFIADNNILWSHSTAPATALEVQVVSSAPPTCASFPTQVVPFTSVYGVTAPIADGDLLVVADPASTDIYAIPGGPGAVGFGDLPLPQFANERYCSPVVLAPGCAATAYVPTAAERSGNFSPFAAALMSITLPNGITLPGGQIPASLTGPGGIGGWRVASVQGCVQASTNPTPAITDLSPSSAIAGSGPLLLTIDGSGFIASSSVTFNGSPHTASFVSASQLSITLSSSDLANAGMFAIVVTNPPPGGGASLPSDFTVASGAPPAGLITATIAGTVSSGVDNIGVFLAAGSDLTGQSFTLIFTFDDTLGTQFVGDCSGVPCSSGIKGASPSSPGTAALTIGGNSYSFGTQPDVSSFSDALRSIPPNLTSAASFEVEDTYPIGADNIGSDSVYIYVTPPPGGPPLTTDYEWNSPFSDSQLLSTFPNSTGFFGISIPVNNVSTSDSVDLVADSITVGSGGTTGSGAAKPRASFWSPALR
jgi:uncharacterized protein (TIGR03437 family)